MSGRRLLCWAPIRYHKRIALFPASLHVMKLTIFHIFPFILIVAFGLNLLQVPLHAFLASSGTDFAYARRRVIASNQNAFPVERIPQ